MSVVTDKPLWFALLCLLLGLFYAAVLYYRENSEQFPPRLRWVMAAFRFLAVTIISFLLLSPLIKTLSHRVEKPVIVFAHDQSQSVLINKDSVFYRQAFDKELRKLTRELAKTYDIREYGFGDVFTDRSGFDYRDKSTNISEAIEEIRTLYANRNVGALVISSDGLYNRGINPLYAAEKLPFPVYTIAMGDTTVLQDLMIARVNYNRTAFLGNKFPVEVLVRGNKSAGTAAVLEVKKEGQVIFSRQIRISGNRYSENVNLNIEAKETGLHHYSFSITPLENEINRENNHHDIYVQVLEGREKVLLLTASPHPDVAALKSAIESNAGYTVQVESASGFSGPVAPYNLIILHQLPSDRMNVTPLVSKAYEAGISVLFVNGSQTNLTLFNTLRAGVNIIQDKGMMTESQPAADPDFVLFTLSEETRRFFNDLPPLSCPFGTYKIQQGVSVLLNQRIGSLVTDKPLILFGQDPGRKYGVIAGEGIWRWRLANYARYSNHDAFNEWVTKMVQYLSIRMSRDFFQVFAGNRYQENEPVIMTAEVLNPSYERITDPAVEITLTDEEGRTYPFAFTPSGNSYYLNAGILPPGIYQFAAQTTVGSKIHRKSGRFTISPLQLETVNTVADHALLYNLASRHGGTMVPATQAGKLADLIAGREDIRNISYTQKRYSDWINLPFVFGLIIALLAAEWFIRKWSGSY